ncbi:DUF6500 family protein [Colwelliaceae bacterium 6471]
MEVAFWWIQTHQLVHFEKATKYFYLLLMLVISNSQDAKPY